MNKNISHILVVDDDNRIRELVKEYLENPHKNFPLPYYKHHKKLDPYIVHFNFLLGEKKEESMKNYGEWYL